MTALNFWKYANVPIQQSELNIVLIAHVCEPRGHLNNSQIQCSKTERFTIDEFNEIYQGIVLAGYFVQAIYYNEIDFINDYLEHPKRFKNSLIYSLARNGLGNNKKTLIPSFCELLGLRYTTSSSLPCALARNKYYFTSLLSIHNLPVPKSWLFTNGTWANGMPEKGIKVICKPASESASQGINETKILTTSGEQSTFLLKSDHIVQEYIDGMECEVPIFKVGERIIVFPPVGINLRGKCVLTEEASEENLYDFYKLDDHISSETIGIIQESAEKAFCLLQMDVYGRVDFRVSNDGKIYIFDISTTPYTTKHSSFAFAFKQMGFDYCDIYRAIITAALLRK